MAELCPFSIAPLAMPRLINNLPIYNINYTSQDYQSLKAKTIDLLKPNFADQFNDINESSLALMLAECWAGMADMLSFKIDQLANELYIDTVTELENAFRLAKLVGFKPLPPLPAKTMFMAKLNSVYSADVEIKTPIIVSLDEYDIHYELYPADANNNPVFNASVIIPSGALFTEAIVGIEGKTRVTTFDSNGKANQIFVIPFDKVFYGSIKVSVNGSVWEQVEYFTESTPKPEYIVEYGAYYKPTLILGDNTLGMVPPKGAKITVSFRVSNINTSEIISGAFDTTVFTELPGISSHVVIGIKNYTKSEFGYPGDSILDIRKKLPAYNRTQNRAVSGADYKYLTDSFATAYNGAIGKSNVVLRNHGCSGNIIDIIVLSKTGDYRLIKSNDNLKKALLEKMNDKKMFTDYLCVKDGEVIYVDINVDAHVNKMYKKSERDVRNEITNKLETYFDLSNWEFGQPLKEKDIIKNLSEVKEVKQFDISFITNRAIESNTGTEDAVYVKYNEIIRPDGIMINFIYETATE